MNRNKLFYSLLAFFFVWSIPARSQQSTITTAFSNNATYGQITFNFQNGNSVPVMITGLDGIVSVSGTANVEVWYRTTPVSSSPGVISTANGWVRFGSGSITGVANTTTTTAQTFFNNLSLVVPANTTYGICVSAYIPGNGTSCLRFSALSTNTTTQNQAGGCTMTNGYNISFAGPYNTALTYTPAAFIGSLTFTTAQPCSGTPTPGNTLASADSVCPGGVDTLRLSNSPFTTGVTYQWQRSVDNNSFTDISGANSPTYVATITNAAWFRCRVSCGSNISYSASKNVTVRNYSNCYCIPGYVNGASYGGYDIQNVTFNTLNYSSTFPSPPYYTNVPESNANTIVFAGNTYNLTVLVGIYCSIRVWFDWNHNGTLEESESTLVGANGGPTGYQTTKSITVPVGALGDKTRMRVRTSYYPSPLGGADACATTSYGETEDYTITVIASSLAIDLKNITARNIGKTNRVAWETLAETGGDYYLLERSVDGQSYSSIAVQQSKGKAATYVYDDHTPANGINYYRLKIVEPNGRYIYSPIVKAIVKDASDLTVEAYPNPVRTSLNVAVYGQMGEKSTVQMIDMTGKVVKTQKITSQLSAINMDNTAPGLYLLKYTDTKTTQIIKINKQ